jgi:hypothetical protein
MGQANRGLCFVLITVPSAKTTVKFTTQSFIVPYLTAFVPLDTVSIQLLGLDLGQHYLQLVPIIPPILACE